MKVFTVHDYNTLTSAEQEAVQEWLSRYDLENVIMVTSQSSMVANAEDRTDFDTFEEDHVAVYVDSIVRRWITPKECIDISNSDISFNAYTKVAEFFFDDFPWPEGY